MSEPMTLAEAVKTIPMSEMFSGTKYPQSVIDSVYRHYKHRAICSDDVQFFADELNDTLITVQTQFMLQLRNEMCEWDPMVQNYMERDYHEESSGEDSKGQDVNWKTTTTGGKTTTHGGIDKVASSSESGNKRTLDTNDKLEGDVTNSGQDTQSRYETRTDDLTHSRDITDTRTDNLRHTRDLTEVRTDDLTHGRNTTTTRSDDTTQSTERDKSDSQIGDVRELTADTPDSKTYTTGGGIIGLLAPEGMPQISHEVGAPAKLDFSYLSSQAERVTTGDSVGREKSKTTNAGTVTTTESGDTSDSGTVSTDLGGYSEDTGTVTSKGSGTESDSGTVKYDVDGTVTYGKATHELTNRSQSGTINDDGSASGEASTTYGHTITDDNNTHVSRTGKLTDSATRSGTADRTQRESGRHEAPQDLLDRARDYILRSNALKWLYSQLDAMFYMILETR